MPTLHPIRLGPFEGARTNATQMIHISSPWDPAHYVAVNFPEHCWAQGMSNVSHMSEEPIECPWVFSDDGSKGELERSLDEGIVCRFSANVEGMSVRTRLEIENGSSELISGIRVLICTRTRFMPTMCVENHDPTFVWTEVGAVNIEEGTTYDGPLPGEGRHACWALNVEGGPDNAALPEMGWFHRGKGPGCVVDEIADPPLIAIQEQGNDQRWMGTIWDPSRILFANPGLPCIHSDPQPPDCPPGETVHADGLILFHDGDLASLKERAMEEMGR